MTWKQAFGSSVGRKFVMGITGVSLVLFLVVHASVNACMWAGLFTTEAYPGEVFNNAAHWLGSTAVPRVLEIGLFLFFIIHILQGYQLEASNLSKRGVGYAVNYGNRGSKWYSRSMGILGTLILLFLVLHLADFWVPSRFQEMPEAKAADGTMVHNLYSLMIARFQLLWVVIIYVLGCISLGYHLAHGFQSAFRSLGLHNRKYLSLLTGTGYVFAIVITIVFAMMPISIYLGWVK